MVARLKLRRHLYETLSRARRHRHALRRQIAVLAADPGPGPDDGTAGVREPRRPLPPTGPGPAVAQAEVPSRPDESRQRPGGLR